MDKIETVTKLPIIAFDDTVWDDIWMNRQHILSRLGKRGWPIIYSNGAHYVRAITLDKIRNKTVRQDNVTLIKCGAFWPRNYKSSLLDRLAINYHCGLLRRIMGIKANDEFIAFCFNPVFYPYVDALKSTYTMFHMYDIFSYAGEQAKYYTPFLEQKADLITAATEIVWDEQVQDKSLTPNIIYNAVNFSWYEDIPEINSEIIRKIKCINGPKIGYLGSISLKLDFILLATLAINNPEWQFILVGKIQEHAMQDNTENWHAYHKFMSCDNVHCMGFVLREETAAVISAMDVNISPYILDRRAWAFSAYPLKINEYLACGKPVVSTGLFLVNKYLKEQVAVCESVEEWQKAISNAIKGNGVGTTESRVQTARDNDWSNRVDKLEKLMIEMIAKKKKIESLLS